MNLRDIKKDIDYVFSAFIEDCTTVAAVNANASTEELEKLYEGYALADVKPYFNEINGGYYLTVQMYKKPAPKRSRKRGNYERQ